MADAKPDQTSRTSQSEFFPRVSGYDIRLRSVWKAGDVFRAVLGDDEDVAHGVVEALAEKGILGGVPVSRLEPGKPALENLLVVASTEVNTDEDRAAFAAALTEVLA